MLCSRSRGIGPRRSNCAHKTSSVVRLGSGIRRYSSISHEDFLARFRENPNVKIVDVRNPNEFTQSHLKGAVNLPLSTLEDNLALLSKTEPLYVVCQAGIRSATAQRLLEEKGFKATCVDQGMNAVSVSSPDSVVSAGPTSTVWDMNRQVRFVAGSFTAVGTMLGSSVHPGFYLIPAFFGLGLAFSGITGSCGMAVMLAKMPWNQPKK